MVGWIIYPDLNQFGSSLDPFRAPHKLGGVVGSDAMAGLLPDRAILDSWTTVADVATWAGVEAGLSRCVLRQLGDPLDIFTNSCSHPD